MKHFSFPLVKNSKGFTESTIPFHTNIPLYVSQLDQATWSLYDYLYLKNPNYCLYNNQSKPYYSDDELKQLGLLHQVQILDDYNFTHLYIYFPLTNPFQEGDVVTDNYRQSWKMIAESPNGSLFELISQVPESQVPQSVTDANGRSYHITTSFVSYDCLIVHASLLPLHKGLLNTYSAYKKNIWLFFGNFEHLINDKYSTDNPTGLNLNTPESPLFSKYQLQNIEKNRDHTEFYFFQWPEANLILSQAYSENEENSATSTARMNINNYFIGRLSSLNNYYAIQLVNKNQTNQLIFTWTEAAEGVYSNSYSFHLYPIRIAHQLTKWPSLTDSISVSSLRSAIGTSWTHAEIASHKLYLQHTRANQIYYDEIITDDTCFTSHHLEQQTWKSFYNITWPSALDYNVYYHIY